MAEERYELTPLGLLAGMDGVDAVNVLDSLRSYAKKCGYNAILLDDDSSSFISIEKVWDSEENL